MCKMKFLLACTPIVLFGNVVLSTHAQVPAAVALPKQDNPSGERVAAEKSVLAEFSKQAAKSEAAAVEFCQCVGHGENSATKRIEKALSAPLHQTGLDYADQPLTDIVTQLAQEYGVPIQLNIVALEEAGIGTDVPVTINLHNISLRSALRLMLKPKQLTYVIEDEVLSITTTADAEKDLIICVYDVRKIAGDKGDILALMDTISSCVAKESWAKNGKGSAEIRSPKPGFLVITQSQAVHSNIRDLLTTIDEMRRDHQADIASPPAKAATSEAAERYPQATPSPPAVRRKPATYANPPKSGGDPNNPFGG